MSDTFDHEQAAWDSLNDDNFYDQQEGDEWAYCGYRKKSKSIFLKDSSFYHKRIEVLRFVAETEKSYLCETSIGKGAWIPKKICRSVYKDQGILFVHYPTYVLINHRVEIK